MSEDADGDDSHYYQTDEKGRIVEQYSDDGFLAAVDALDGASTGDVADHLGCSRRLARDRLKALASDGRIEQIEAGNGFTWLSSDE